ncbi:MAG TPA: esterase family protein [Firmicutes bacterium]|nr:esterase family protein [Bacillota bacterium]
MGLIDFRFFAQSIRLHTSVQVLLPYRLEMCKEPLPVLYLLHGLSDDCSAWIRMSSIERYAADRRLAVVMPEVGRSFYCDMVHGQNYFTYISQELPWVMQTVFPISSRREDTYVAGLSMGGFGAFKLALNYPERFRGAASFSGAMDLMELHREGNLSEEQKLLVSSIWDGKTDLTGTCDDLKTLALQLEQSGKEAPILYQWCGTEDFLHDINVRFRDFIQTNTHLPYTYTESPGNHTWKYWDWQIEKALDFFGL